MKMKKIKNLRQLREEKMRLRVKELELEKTIHKDWIEIREQLQPGNILKNHRDTIGNTHWLINGLNIAASSLTKKILEKAEEKIESKADKGIEYISRRVNNLFR
jgi:hypothetical protein